MNRHPQVFIVCFDWSEQTPKCAFSSMDKAESYIAKQETVCGIDVGGGRNIPYFTIQEFCVDEEN